MLQFVPQALWRSVVAPSRLPLLDGQVIHVSDTISSFSPDGTDADEVVPRLLWPRGDFQVTARHSSATGDLSLQFPSPRPRGNPAWDTVVLDWHMARSQGGRSNAAPAVLVLDILQGGHIVAGYIAKSLAKNGIHGLVLHMPQNGLRRKQGAPHDWAEFLPNLSQAASDVRRARDVIASLPLVRGPIGLQGTSLGGFVATLAASIDNAFDPVLLALSGGDVYDVLSTGRADAAKVRQHLRQAGYTDQKLRDWLWQIEPMRVAHRLNPARTWLFSARFDQVVRSSNSKKLADTIGLSWQHHRQLAGCHYTCALGARRFMSEVISAIGRPIRPSPSVVSPQVSRRLPIVQTA